MGYGKSLKKRTKVDVFKFRGSDPQNAPHFCKEDPTLSQRIFKGLLTDEWLEKHPLEASKIKDTPDGYKLVEVADRYLPKDDLEYIGMSVGESAVGAQECRGGGGSE